MILIGRNHGETVLPNSGFKSPNAADVVVCVSSAHVVSLDNNELAPRNYFMRG
jgi:hypothetical protein